MKSITMTIAAGVALLGGAPNAPAAPFAPSDSLEHLTALEPGALVRARFAERGDEWRPVEELTGRFVDLERDALRLEVRDGIHTQRHRLAFDDVLRLELGIAHPRTARGAIVGGLTGLVLGAAVIAADGADGGAFDSDGAEYAVGAAMFGLVGAGVGALIGSRQETTEWRPVRLPSAPSR